MCVDFSSLLFRCRSYLLLLTFVAVTCSALANPSQTSTSSVSPDDNRDCVQAQRFTFSWPLLEYCIDMTPRGGTSRGPSVTLDHAIHQGWQVLQRQDIDNFEKDRRAILAMAGPYRTSFDFLETIGYTPDFRADRPYQSWGTEYVYVAEDRGDLISLQHVMVMFFESDDGISGPMVMKHWRQDWQYEKREVLAYIGHNTWQRKKLSRQASRGRWSQAVFQVDDSPRYEALGRWQHKPNFSTWISDTTWRPLPRREHSVRDDYHVLEGTNRHTILPNGWVHEEENYKVVLNDSGRPTGKTPYLAKELGLNRYERIINHDFSAGDRYWKLSSPFWRDVRGIWREIISKNTTIRLEKTVDGVPLFMPMFEYAEKLQKQPYNSQDGRAFIRSTLAAYLDQ